MSTVTVDPDIHEQGEPWPSHFGEPGFECDPHVVVRAADTPAVRRAVAEVIEAWSRVDATGRLHGPFADRLDPAALEMYELGSPGYTSVHRLPDGYLLYADADGEHRRSMTEGLVRVTVDILDRAGVEARLSVPTSAERDGGVHITDAELEAWASQ